MVQQTTTWTQPIAASLAGRPIASANSCAPASEDDAAMVRRVGMRLQAQDGARLPSRCVCCGDTIALRTFRTIGGNVRYAVCREHRVSSAARLCVGIVMILTAAWSLGIPLLDGARPGKSAVVAFGTVFIVGVVMAWFAVPLRAGVGRGGWRRLSGACAEVVREVDAI